MKIDKTKFKDKMGRPLTQSLFLEPTYNTDFAFYTLTSGEDKEYKGKIYYSLKKLYLASSDPIEYNFANTYLIDWDHWQKLCNNAIIRNEIDKWRHELDLKLMSEGVQTMIDQSEDNMQAAKWLAERGWNRKSVGRPKKDEIESDRRLEAELSEQFSADILRMEDHR